MTSVNLESVRQYVEVAIWCKQRQAEIKELEASAKAEIQAAMGEAETGLLDGVPAVKWSSYKKRQLDQKALKDERPEIHEEYVKTVEARRFELINE